MADGAPAIAADRHGGRDAGAPGARAGPGAGARASNGAGARAGAGAGAGASNGQAETAGQGTAAAPGDNVITQCLYRGHVMHMRLRPFEHRFRYRVFSLLLDVDRLEETCRGLSLLALDRFAVLAFHRCDHGPRDGSDLRPWVEAQLAAAGLPARPARIWLLSFPRLFGYVFNPLSVYWCVDGRDRVYAVVYEVKNTFGDQHPYVLPIDADDPTPARHGTAKAFFVSPFLDMGQRYRFTLARPGRRPAIRIRQGHAGDGPEGDWLIATQNGTRRPLSDRALLAAFASHPLMTLKVFAAIHWQALRLWLKGATFHPYRGAYPTDPRAIGRVPGRPAADSPAERTPGLPSQAPHL
ncbi:MAG: DUF1365 domain-containing protein [Pseudomonadota bacterium]